MSDAAQQLVQQMQVLERHFLDLSNSEQTSLNYYQQIIDTIESLRSFLSQDESEALIPIGGGVSLPAKIDSTKKVVLNIGAGVSVERDIRSTISTLEIRTKELEAGLNEIGKKKRDIAYHIEQGRAQLDQLVAAQNPDQGM